MAYSLPPGSPNYTGAPGPKKEGGRGVCPSTSPEEEEETGGEEGPRGAPEGGHWLSFGSRSCGPLLPAHPRPPALVPP